MKRNPPPLGDTGRILPRYTDQAIPHDPLEQLLARRELERQQAIALINAGHTPDANPEDLRGIPVLARGVGGTSPGTNPATAILRLDHRLRRTISP